LLQPVILVEALAGESTLDNRKVRPFDISRILAFVLVCGCAETIPVKYEAQNVVRYEGQAEVGKFTYTATQDGIASNQLENTEPASVYIGADVADLVRRATALELEKTGVVLTERSPIRLSGDVLRFLKDDLGINVDWTYCVRYRLARKSDSREVFDAVYKVAKRSGKSKLAADMAPTVNELILSAYDQFIRDGRARGILGASAEELAELQPASAPAPPAACVPRSRLPPEKLVRCEEDTDCKDGTACYQGACRRL
jgi:hypothetical protein